LFGDGGEKGNELIFGTSDGKFGLITVAGYEIYISDLFLKNE